METIERTKMVKVKDDILIYISEIHQIKFSKVFEFPESPGMFLAHINIWEDNAPFYFLFNRQDTRKLQLKGYQKSTFISNSFIVGFDKKGKMFLKHALNNANCYLRYHPITSVSDLRKLVLLKNRGHEIHTGFPKNGRLGIGEAFEIVHTV